MYPWTVLFGLHDDARLGLQDREGGFGVVVLKKISVFCSEVMSGIVA